MPSSQAPRTPVQNAGAPPLADGSPETAAAVAHINRLLTDPMASLTGPQPQPVSRRPQSQSTAELAHLIGMSGEDARSRLTDPSDTAKSYAIGHDRYGQLFPTGEDRPNGVQAMRGFWRAA